MPDTRGMSDEQVSELSVNDLLELELIPIIARVVSILPEDIGTTKSSCGSSQYSHGDDAHKPSKNHHHGLVWCS